MSTRRSDHTALMSEPVVPVAAASAFGGMHTIRANGSLDETIALLAPCRLRVAAEDVHRLDADELEHPVRTASRVAP